MKSLARHRYFAKRSPVGPWVAIVAVASLGAALLAAQQIGQSPSCAADQCAKTEVSRAVSNQDSPRRGDERRG